MVERHQTHVAAPAETTLAAATEIGIQQVPIAGVLFKVRGFLLGGHPDEAEPPQGVLAWMKSLGWNELVEVPGREIVIGAVMQPWKASASPRLVPSAEFAEFREPGYVKIATAFRADPMGADASIFRLESRAVATDPTSRAMFRLYWSLAAPGSVLIRMMARGPIKREA